MTKAPSIDEVPTPQIKHTRYVEHTIPSAKIGGHSRTIKKPVPVGGADIEMTETDNPVANQSNIDTYPDKSQSPIKSTKRHQRDRKATTNESAVQENNSARVPVANKKQQEKRGWENEDSDVINTSAPSTVH